MKLKDNRVTITKIDPNYKEIRKLDALLTEAGIPHTFQTLYWNKTGDLRALRSYTRRTARTGWPT